MNRYEHIPHATLSPSDINALGDIIRGYLPFLRNGVPPSKKRTEQLHTLQRLQKRLTIMVNAHGVISGILLTNDEIQALDTALRGFVTLLRQLVPASAERDGMLLAIEGLQQHLAVLIAPLSC